MTLPSVIGPDWDFWIHLARHARFGYLDRPTCMYRIHQTNITLTSGLGTTISDYLVQGRLKVMNRPGFQSFRSKRAAGSSVTCSSTYWATRPTRQDTIMATSSFLTLPAEAQANLLRLVARHHLGQRPGTEFALNCLRGARLTCNRTT